MFCPACFVMVVDAAFLAMRLEIAFFVMVFVGIAMVFDVGFVMVFDVGFVMVSDVTERWSSI